MPQVTLYPAAVAAISGATLLTTPSNAYADDAVYATANLTTSSSPNLAGARYTQFGADTAIPAGATITRVQLQAKYHIGNGARNGTQHQQARVGGVALTDHPTTLSQTADTYTPFDITAERSWTRNDLLNANFAYDLTVAALTSLNMLYSLDVVALIVDYTTAVTINATPAGGTVLGGTSSRSLTKTTAQTGGIRLGGSATSTVGHGYTRAPTGGIRLGGTVTTRFLGPILITAPVVTGSVTQGQVLTCSPGTWQQSS